MFMEPLTTHKLKRAVKLRSSAQRYNIRQTDKQRLESVHCRQRTRLV